jgi:competence protein ComEA
LLAHAALDPALQRVAAPLSAHNAFLKDVPMLKRILVALLAFLALSVFAADVNTASQADLEAIKGIGPAIATKIIDERKNGSFKDWPDLVNRVKGIGDTSANKLSTGGLTVNGATYSGAPAPAAKTPMVAKTATAAPAAAASTADPKVGVLAKTGTIASAAAAAPAASSAKELKKAEADARKAAKAARKADKAAAASAASAAKK